MKPNANAGTARPTSASKKGPPSGGLTTVLRQRLQAVDIDAKRRPGSEAGIEAWYPYYAGYTEEFAAQVIEASGLGPKSTVLDPWNGCGTTTHVADAQGHKAIGIDINPVATLVASAKLARAQDAIHVTGLAGRLAARGLGEPAPLTAGDPLRKWLCPALTRTYRSIEQGVLADLAVRDGVLLSPFAQALPPLAAFLVLALQRAARRFAGIKTTSNPTWLRPRTRAPRHDAAAFAGAWLKMVRSMAADLVAAEGHAHRTGSQVLLGDARSLPLDEHTVDLVVTSPPYCTRIDYVVNTSLELAALGVGNKQPLFDELRRTSMGTPLARRAAAPAADTFPDEVARVLSSIREHPSKASSNYYYKTYAQYFSDSMTSVAELRRVLKPGAAAVLVVQSSYYKDIYVDLPELYLAMGHALHMRAAIAVEYDVNRFLAQINSRSTAHRKSTSHREAVVVLEAA
jgi:DNA modification methylase